MFGLFLFLLNAAAAAIFTYKTVIEFAKHDYEAAAIFAAATMFLFVVSVGHGMLLALSIL